MYSVADTQLTLGGFPHSEISGSKAGYRLPETYRRFLRPSSPLAAKASTVCTYSLDYIRQATDIAGLTLNRFVITVILFARHERKQLQIKVTTVIDTI